MYAKNSNNNKGDVDEIADDRSPHEAKKIED